MIDNIEQLRILVSIILEFANNNCLNCGCCGGNDTNINDELLGKLQLELKDKFANE